MGELIREKGDVPDIERKGEMSSEPCPLMGCYVPDFVPHGHCLFTKPLACVFAAARCTGDGFINNLIPNGKMKK